MSKNDTQKKKDFEEVKKKEEEIESGITELESSIKEWDDRYKRVLADYQNLRNVFRTKKENGSSLQTENLLQDYYPYLIHSFLQISIPVTKIFRLPYHNFWIH
jgi:molecular chaperone GrpE (heat shock protein)